ncbi:MAG: bifunctional diaminohydroxyphosphoribosylaminopyrimidine deaminase/5-amino-6-(5-phosphoribosylamino)uracil reductase RibD [Limisphaerales bacterium]
MMRRAIKLAQRGYGTTTPNPMVGAVLVKAGKVIGEGWHHRAGLPHAEIEALRDAERKGHNPKGATFYVTLEPCSTHGRTPPCTEALIKAGIKHVVTGAIDPNPNHAGNGLKLLQRAKIAVTSGVLEDECMRLNEAFNHWVVHRTPFVVVKSAMSLDGRIATKTGESQWITNEQSRVEGMKLRAGCDAIVVGINTILRDNPRLTIRGEYAAKRTFPLRRMVLDPSGRIQLNANLLTDEFKTSTTIVVTELAPKRKVETLRKTANVIVAPTKRGKIDLRWLLKKLGRENVTRLLVEGGGETNAEFLLNGFAHRVAFFYAPIVIGGREGPRAVGGDGILKLEDKIVLEDVEWHSFGGDLLLNARVKAR